jgi:RNA polymerase sigma-70 factor (sigma-E family)
MAGPARAGAVMADRTPAKDAEFSTWMTARQPALLRTAYLLTGDHHSAEDLVQNTLAKVYLHWDKVHRREAVDAYARRILVNENNSVWRRAWKRREVSTDEVADRVGTHDEYDEGHSAALWRFVQTLPRKQRAVIVLRYYEELSEAETAEVLGISSGTVKSQASRALAALRERAAEQGFQRQDLGEEER